MDPQVVSPEQWDQISRLMIYLFVFVGLAVNAALAFLVGHAIIPSLVGTADAPRELQALRWVLYPASAASLALTLYALGWAIYLAIVVLRQIYPRFGI
jgi:hypothetical protein